MPPCRSHHRASLSSTLFSLSLSLLSLTDDEDIDVLQEVLHLMQQALDMLPERDEREKAEEKRQQALEKNANSESEADKAVHKAEAERWKKRWALNEHFVNTAFGRMMKVVLRRR
jgi:FKBP-type peptidyl-prolyl cis-trans isomerase